MKTIADQINEAVMSGKKGFTVDGTSDDVFPYNTIVAGRIIQRTKVRHNEPGTPLHGTVRAWYRTKGKVKNGTG